MLEDCRVLVAEDEYFLATHTARLLESAGAIVVGPISSLTALREQVSAKSFDAALLDIRLDQDLIFPIADMLLQAGIPLAFLTGYDREVVPERFASVPICQKPCGDEVIVRMVAALCDSGGHED